MEIGCDCSGFIPSRATFCPFCGNEIPKQCVACNTKIRNHDSNACVKCGTLTPKGERLGIIGINVCGCEGISFQRKGDNFCSICASKIKQQDICSNCGNQLEESWNRCIDCGSLTPKAEFEIKTKQDAERKARQDAERKARQEEEARTKARQDAERKARQEQEARAKVILQRTNNFFEHGELMTITPDEFEDIRKSNLQSDLIRILLIILEKLAQKGIRSGSPHQGPWTKDGGNPIAQKFTNTHFAIRQSFQLFYDQNNIDQEDSILERWEDSRKVIIEEMKHCKIGEIFEGLNGEIKNEYFSMYPDLVILSGQKKNWSEWFLSELIRFIDEEMTYEETCDDSELHFCSCCKYTVVDHDDGSYWCEYCEHEVDSDGGCCSDCELCDGDEDGYISCEYCREWSGDWSHDQNTPLGGWFSVEIFLHSKNWFIHNLIGHQYLKNNLEDKYNQLIKTLRYNCILNHQLDDGEWVDERYYDNYADDEQELELTYYSKMLDAVNSVFFFKDNIEDMIKNYDNQSIIDEEQELLLELIANQMRSGDLFLRYYYDSDERYDGVQMCGHHSSIPILELLKGYLGRNGFDFPQTGDFVFSNNNWYFGVDIF